MTLFMVGAVGRSFLSEGDNLGIDGKGPFTKGLTIVPHRYEYERFSAYMATLWQEDGLQPPIRDRHITFQTRNRANNYGMCCYLSPKGPPLIAPPATASPSPSKHGRPDKIGKLSFSTYASPAAKPVARVQNSLDFSDNGMISFFSIRLSSPLSLRSAVPIYDARDFSFDPSDVPGSIESLPPWTDGSELAQGTGVVVGFTSGTSKYNGWKLTLYVQWVVVIALERAD